MKNIDVNKIEKLLKDNNLHKTKWGIRLIKLANRDFSPEYLTESLDLASDWLSCACGERFNRIIWVNGRPDDYTLYSLDRAFSSNIGYGFYLEACKILIAIENRVKELEATTTQDKIERLKKQISDAEKEIKSLEDSKFIGKIYKHRVSPTYLCVTGKVDNIVKGISYAISKNFVEVRRDSYKVADINRFWEKADKSVTYEKLHEMVEESLNNLLKGEIE